MTLGKMWSVAAVLVMVLTVLAFGQVASGVIYQYRPRNADNIKSPKRESSSLLLGGRFGRSCIGERCLGKRSKTWNPSAELRPEIPDVSAGMLKRFLNQASKSLFRKPSAEKNLIGQENDKVYLPKLLNSAEERPPQLLRLLDPDYSYSQ